jgi:hypothetical protein
MMFTVPVGALTVISKSEAVDCALPTVQPAPIEPMVTRAMNSFFIGFPPRRYTDPMKAILAKAIRIAVVSTLAYHFVWYLPL